jgi:hypothetical protein
VFLALSKAAILGTPWKVLMARGGWIDY